MYNFVPSSEGATFSSNFLHPAKIIERRWTNDDYARQIVSQAGATSSLGKKRVILPSSTSHMPLSFSLNLFSARIDLLASVIRLG